jgi:hypothetical protein
MTRRLRLLLATVAVAAAGAGVGRVARCLGEPGPSVAPTERPEDLAGAWARFAAGAPADVPVRAASDAFEAERDLLRAVSAGTDAALEEVARRRVGTNAGALAEILLVERASGAEERSARRAAFASRYPRSWWNAAPTARTPRR